IMAADPEMRGEKARPQETDEIRFILPDVGTPPPLRRGKRLIAGIRGFTSASRYTRHEHGRVLSAPMILTFCVSTGAGVSQRSLDEHKPRARYVIDGKPTRWYDYPDYDHEITPEELGPGCHLVYAEAEAPGVIFMSEKFPLTVPGRDGPQPIHVGPNKYYMVRKEGLIPAAGLGHFTVEWTGKDPEPVPLRHRPATPFSERILLDDLWCQAVLPYTGHGIHRPYAIREGAGVMPGAPQLYYPGLLQGRRHPKVMGPRGVATTLPFYVDGHVSKAGNFYALATCGSIVKIHTTGTQEILAGWYNDRGTHVSSGDPTGWPDPRDRFYGTFTNNDKKGWREPWAFAFRADSIAVTPDETQPRGGFHERNIQALVGDTLHGDLDLVEWDRNFDDPVRPPKITTIARGLGEVWGVTYDPCRRRWWYTVRSSINGRFPGKGHEIGWVDADSLERHVLFRCPDPPKDRISPSVSHRRAFVWASRRAARAAQAAENRARHFREGPLDAARFVFPEQIKMLSDGRLVVSSQYLALIAVIDPERGTLEMGVDALSTMAVDAYWLNIQVDDGTTGPRDQIWFCNWMRFSGAPWVARLGEEPVANVTGDLHRELQQGPGRNMIEMNYPMCAVPGNGAIYMAGGVNGVLRFTKKLPTDPAIDVAAVARGKRKYELGTLPDREPIRPSLEFMHGPMGLDQWGGKPFAWRLPPELANDPDIAAYLAHCKMGTVYEDG
ncbi:MAG TPA: hypothetical protein VIK87_01460, partial [Sphingomonadales bacterium]